MNCRYRLGEIMIELKDLTKTYKLKSGDVHALKGIDLTLPDKGMVFILGKSGCGKSTLLNVLGGLDNYTSGEIIVDGVSLKSFKAKDYDEYRNKYIGFIFQEYNLIDNFNVEQNISLALELQKEKNKQYLVEESLEQVGLQGYGKRHINELSGGQKQRVAIARALIKNPSMILADEPTGNLDSITAGEVFDILKKLSEERLIVVVSHDRESAERYGDRIVELQDGEIISDTVLKDTAKEGSVEEKEVRKQKRAGNMPFGRAFTYAMSNLWHKKIRVTVSILLFIITLGLFNFAYATSLFDIYKTAEEAFYATGDKVVYLDCGYETERYDFIENTFKEEAQPIYYDRAFIMGIYQENPVKSEYYVSDSIYYSTEINKDLMNKYGIKLLYGRLPENSSEVCLSKYIAECILYVGKPQWDQFGITQINQLIGKTDRDNSLEIVGIIDTNLSEEFDILKELSRDDFQEYSDYFYKFSEETNQATLHTSMFCHKSYYKSCYIPNDRYVDYTFRGFSKRGEAYNKYMLDKNSIEYKVIPDAREGVIVNRTNLVSLKNMMGNTNPMTDDEMLEFIAENNFEASIYNNYKGSSVDAPIIGFYKEDYDNNIYLTQGTIEEMRKNAYCIESVIIDVDNTRAIRRAIELSNLNDASADLRINHTASQELEHSRSYALLEKEICGIASPIFAVIVILLLLNYFMSTIKDKNGEIGILRAIGVKNSNIIGIFLLEAVIICLIAYIISLPISFYMANHRDAATMNSLAEGYDVFVRHVFIGFESCMVTLAISIGVAIIGCITPFIKLGRMKPMEIIRQK